MNYQEQEIFESLQFNQAKQDEQEHKMHRQVSKLYKTVQFLGSGSFAEVYKVVSKNKYYAIKKISLHRLVNASFKKQISQEIKIMKKIKHPRIITLYQVYQTQNHLCLVLEYASGGSLFDKLNSYGRFSQQTAKKYIIDVLDALQYLHQQKQPILHRDIKPQNILLDGEGRCKIADFGSSNVLCDGSLRNTFTGTDGYRAPQASQGQAQDCGVDIWSVGVLIYELLVGKIPEGRKSMIEDYQSNRNSSSLYFPEHVSRSAQDLIKKILNKNPNQRISLEQIRQHIWLCDLISQQQEALQFVRSVQARVSKYPKSTFLRNSSNYHQCSGIFVKQRSCLQITKQKSAKLYESFYEKHKNISANSEKEQVIYRVSETQKDTLIKKAVQQKIYLLNMKSNLKLQLEVNKMNIQRKIKWQQNQSQLLREQQERWLQKIKQYQGNIELLKKSPAKFKYDLLDTFKKLRKNIDSLRNYISLLPRITERQLCNFPLPQNFPRSGLFFSQSEYIPKLMQQFLQVRRDALLNLKAVAKTYNQIRQLSMLEQSRMIEKNQLSHSQN